MSNKQVDHDKVKGTLIDITKCIGCRGCQVACKNWNELEAEKTTFFANPENGYQNPGGLNENTFSIVTFWEFPPDKSPDGKLRWHFARRQCMHCDVPNCASVCPVGALQKDPNDGSVWYDKDKCLGCRYCMLACPFGIPTYTWSRGDGYFQYPYVRKCTYCHDRTSATDDPEHHQRQKIYLSACAKACPTGAIYMSTFNDVRQEAEKRIADNPSRYNPKIYGLEEAGGTSWLYLAPAGISFTQLGFREDITPQETDRYTTSWLTAVPWIVAGGSAVLSALYFISKRKEEVQKASK